MKITFEMVKYWLGEFNNKEIITDFKDLANRDYAISLLRKDIIQTWKNKTVA